VPEAVNSSFPVTRLVKHTLTLNLKYAASTQFHSINYLAVCDLSLREAPIIPLQDEMKSSYGWLKLENISAP
jgi:hypothetical protein